MAQLGLSIANADTRLMKGWRNGRAAFQLLVALLLSWTHDSLALLCGQRISHKSEEITISGIIGGEAADIRDFPWQVGIFMEGNHICGGTILSEWWILTASHCFSKNTNKSSFKIVYGEDDLDTKNLNNVDVDKLIMHPYYDDWILDNDIALILLKSPLQFGTNRLPICLSEVSDIQGWSNCWVTGWGATNHSQSMNTTQKLQKLNLELFTWTKCFQILPFFTKNMLCAGHPESGKDACQGDSGSPLVCNKRKNNLTWYQVGIVSWGVECGKKEYPGVYTKVSRYLRWISKETTKAGRPYMYEADAGYSLLFSVWAILFLYFVMLLLTW